MNGCCGLNEITGQVVWRFYFGHCVLIFILSGIGMTECFRVEFWDHIYYLNIALMVLTISLGAKAHKTAISDQKYVENYYVRMKSTIEQFGANTHLTEIFDSIKGFLTGLRVEAHEEFRGLGDRMERYLEKVNATLDENGEVLENVVMEIQARNPG